MSNFALLDPLLSGYSWNPNQELTFAFRPAGDRVDDGGYSGGSQFTSAWDAAGREQVRAVFAQIEALTNLRTAEVGNVARADIVLSSVAEVPGGWAGYADYPDRGGQSEATIGADYTNLRDNTVVHEIGHAMGLKHPHEFPRFPGVDGSNDYGDFALNNVMITTMSYNPAYDPVDELDIGGRQNHYMAADIAALQEIYGANRNHARGDTRYELKDALICIWDGGGTDVIDYSAARRTVVIDLTAATLRAEQGGGGYLSYEWTGGRVEGGYTIAHGVVIENALGGDGSDTLYGNAANNRLAGNGGGDWMYGGRGDDRMLGNDGNDRLTGAGGDDVLTGGAGSDRFIFAAGSDRITDFADNTDTIVIGGGLARGYGSARALLDDLAVVRNGAVVIDFGPGDAPVLRVEGVSRVAALNDDLVLG